jgi:hypothetical protein
MAHPILHAKSSAKKFGGIWEDYIHLHNWLDETKSWYGHSFHRMWRHHSEGIFEMEQRFGPEFKNSDGKTVYTRYVGEQHVKEDCDGYIPTAREWFQIVENKQRPLWAIRSEKLEFED